MLPEWKSLCCICCWVFELKSGYVPELAQINTSNHLLHALQIPDSFNDMVTQEWRLGRLLVTIRAIILLLRMVLDEARLLSFKHIFLGHNLNY